MHPSLDDVRMPKFISKNYIIFYIYCVQGTQRFFHCVHYDSKYLRMKTINSTPFAMITVLY